MRAEIAPCLTQLRREAGRDGKAARLVGNDIQLYPKAPPPTSFTDHQKLTQEVMKMAGSAWRFLEEDAQQGWTAYARRHAPADWKKRRGRLAGQQLYSGAAIRRLMMAADPPENVPELAPPPSLTGLELLPAEGDPRAFRFVVRHELAGGDGMLLVVRLTPATIRFARKPRWCDSVLICGFHPESAVALPASGGVAAFPPSRIAVEPGRRFGVWATLFRLRDGIAGPETFHDFDRF